MKGSLGLLQFTDEVTKIMVLPMGFHNLQKVLSLVYVFLKTEFRRNRLWKARWLLGAFC